MKRFVKCLLFIISIFFINIYSVYAEEDIIIKSIRVVGQSGTITLNDLDYSENNIYSNIIFNQVNDFVTYEVELENSSYKKYLLESVSLNTDTNYLVVSSDEVNTYIDPKGTSTIQLKVKYENELINQEEVNLDNLSLTLNYSYEDITNPETGFNLDNIILFIIALSLIGVGFVLFKIKKKQVIVLFLLLPMFVLAKEYKPVTINFSNIKIKGRFLNYRVEVDNGSGEFSLRQRTYGEEVGMLATPTKRGYTFTGWKDQDGNQITEETQIEKDTVVSAQYEPIEYTITYNLDGGVLSKENPTTYTTEDEFTINNPTKEGYTFVGWDIGKEFYPNLTFYKGMINDITLTALYTQEPTAQYTVIHKKENDSGEFVEVERELFSGPVGLDVCPQARRYEGYHARWGDCLTITEDGMSSVTYNYSRAKLRFEVTSFDGLDTENSTKSGAYPYGTIITLNAEERPGYTLWWSDGETGFSRTFTLTKNTSLSAQYIPNGNVQYKVIHKLQSLDTGMIGRVESDQVNDGYYVEDISYFDGLIGEEVEPPTNIYEGFTAPSVERVTLSEDSSRTITYYYTRNKYRLTIEEEENVETDTPSGEYYYGTWINLKAKKIEGYSFDHWSDGSTNNPYGFELLGDTTIKAIYGDPAAIFDSGISVNQKMKRLAGNSGASYSTQDNNIQQIVKANALPDGFSPTSDNIVSSSNSDYPIYMWYEDNTIYYYSSVDKIYLGQPYYMFQELRNLGSIEGINNWDTSKATTMYCMFNNAGYSATSFNIDLSNWDTSNVRNMEKMFSFAGCNATTWSIGDLSHWNVSNVIYMTAMFQCAGHNATTWNIGDLSNWNVSNVVRMSVMFNNAGYSATTWNIGDLSNWETSKVTNMSGMFSDAGQKATTWNIGDLSNWDTSNVTNMESMFYATGQNATTWNIGDLSDWDTSKVTSMFQMFANVGQSTTTWSIGDLSNWDTSKVTNMSQMFANAGQSATTWSIGDLSNWDTSKVTNMSQMFLNTGVNSRAWNTIGNLKVYADDIRDMFHYSSKVKATITIYRNPTSYSNVFENAATASSSVITVNYTSDVTDIDNIIATRSNNSKVYKGSLININ